MSMPMHNQQILDYIIQRTQAVDKGGYYMGHCPAHDDHNPSLKIKINNGWINQTCFANCPEDRILAEEKLSKQDIRPLNNNVSNSNGKAKKQGWGYDKKANITLEQLAENKKIPLDYLQKRGLKTTRHDFYGTCVEIPYFNVDGKRMPTKRFRCGPRGADSIFQCKTKPGMYGLQFLNNRIHDAGYAIIVEGESDCWTLWYHAFPALGIPGVLHYNVLKSNHVSGLKKIYINNEGGEQNQGDKFVENIANKLASFSWTGELYMIRCTPYKDPNDAHKAMSADEFRAFFQRVLDNAERIEVKAKDPAPLSENNRSKAPEFGTALTDLGNAQRLFLKHGVDIKYCPSWKNFVIWDGTRWAKDDLNLIGQHAIDAVLSIFAEAGKTLDEEKQKNIVKHAYSSQANNKIQSMLGQYKNLANVCVKPEIFDIDPWLFNVKNGTVDLRTGCLEPHKQANLITKISPIEFDAAAKCPVFLKFIDRIFNGNQDLIAFIQRVVGYCLTGDVGERVFFILWGSGSNGKSKFIDVLNLLLGEYATGAEIDTFLDQRFEKSSSAPSEDMANLAGARLVSSVEIKENRKLNVSRIKQISGGDLIRARFLHQNSFQFKAQFKLVIATNYKPNVDATDQAAWNRIRLIPFTVTIPESEQDPQIVEKMKPELPGILNWAIQGCLEWQKRRLGIPDVVAEATGEYRVEMDVVGRFIADCCVIHKDCMVEKGLLYREFEAWCDTSGEKRVTKTAFGKNVSSHKYDEYRNGNSRHWLGLGLISEYPNISPMKPMTRMTPNEYNFLDDATSYEEETTQTCHNVSSCHCVTNEEPTNQPCRYEPKMNPDGSIATPF